MKKSFLMAIACVIALASFANHKDKGSKHAKKATTTFVLVLAIKVHVFAVN